MVVGVRHLGIPVIVASLGKVDDTRRHRDPSQTAAGTHHLGLDFRLGTVSFSAVSAQIRG
jgi:hypothetical protein